MSEVKFDRMGFAIISLYARHRDTPTMYSEDYKVDTGASCTTISKDWLFELGYDEDWIKSGKRLEGAARPTVASGQPLDDCYEVSTVHSPFCHSERSEESWFLSIKDPSLRSG